MSSALAWRSTALLPWSCRADAIASAAAALVAAADEAVPGGADDDADDDADAVLDDAGDGADAVLGAVVFLFLAAAAACSIPNGFIEEGMGTTRVHASVDCLH